MECCQWSSLFQVAIPSPPMNQFYESKMTQFFFFKSKIGYITYASMNHQTPCHNFPTGEYHSYNSPSLKKL